MTRYDSTGQTSDFDQYLSQLQLYLSKYLFKFEYELGQIMTRYDFLEDVFRKCSSWLQFHLYVYILLVLYVNWCS